MRTILCAALLLATPALAEDFTLSADELRLLPLGRDSRTFEDAALLAPAVRRDRYGLQLGGASSPETAFRIDGLRVSDPLYGLQGTTLLLDFIQSITVTDAGSSTGGAVDVETKSGLGDFHGSVFAHVTPLEASRAEAPISSTIGQSTRLLRNLDLGAELSGPIVRERLWFYAGLAPQFLGDEVARVVSARTDDGSGRARLGPDGNPLETEIARSTYARTAETLFYVGKLTFVPLSEQRLSLSVYGNPTGVGGPFASLNGSEGTFVGTQRSGSFDALLRYAGHAFGRSLLLAATLGLHRQNAAREAATSDSATQISDLPSLILPGTRSLADPFLNGDLGAPAAQKAALAKCALQPSGFDPCPVGNYALGGPGLLYQQTLQRLQAGARAIWTVQAAGEHVISGGVEAQRLDSSQDQTFSGGFTGTQSGNSISLLGFGHADPARPGLPEQQPGVTAPLRLAGSVDHESTQGTSFSVFAQDTWTIAQRFSVQGGLRALRQQLYVDRNLRAPGGASLVQGAQLALTSVMPLFSIAAELPAGVRAFAGWSRQSEELPLSLPTNTLSSPRFVQLRVNANSCSDAHDPRTCGVIPNGAGGGRTYAFAGGTQAELVDPQLSPQTLDRFEAGVSVRGPAGVLFGVRGLQTQQQSVIEDLSTTGGATYVLSNPGASLGAALPSPERTYRALTLSADRAFEAGWLLHASYTRSSLSGNYSGLFDDESGALLPNATADFDSASASVNRAGGPLPGDVQHSLRLSGAYRRALSEAAWLAVGAVLRADGGAPASYLASGEVFILPRGLAGRMSWQSQLDLRGAVGTRLGSRYELSGSVDVFNLTNNQAETQVDQLYTFDQVNPIQNGKPSDLAFLRTTAGTPVTLNPHFLLPTAWQQPLAIRFGGRLSW